MSDEPPREAMVQGRRRLEAELRCERARGFSLDVRLEWSGEGTLVVVGPSGAGKTTLLRCLAGLEPRARGRLRYGRDVWQDDALGLRRPAERRPIGFVFQEDALFPHLSVRGNLELALRFAPEPRLVQLPEVVERLGLGAWLERRPAQLSGGQKRRVALGRALLTQPELLLLDEPLTGLEPTLRTRLAGELAALASRWSVPRVVVSHTLEDALRWADHVVVLSAGRILDAGGLVEVSERGLLRDLFAAEGFLLLEGDGGRAWIRFDQLVLVVGSVTSGAARTFAVHVERIEPDGDSHSLVWCRDEARSYPIRLEQGRCSALGLREGSSCSLLLGALEPLRQEAPTRTEDAPRTR